MPYKIGYAPSSGGLCSVCTKRSAKVIPAGDVQFGVFYIDSFSGEEKLTWRHVGCVNSTQMKNIAKVYPFGKGIVDWDVLSDADQSKIKNHFEHYTGPLNSFEDALRAQGRKYAFAEESEIQPEPSERANSPVQGSDSAGPSWGTREERSSSVASAAPPTPSTGPPRYRPRPAVASNQPRQMVDSGAASLIKEREDLTISELGLSLVDLDLASARVEYAASLADTEKAKKRAAEWELNKLIRRAQTSGDSSLFQERIEDLEMQVIQGELKVAEALTKLAEVRIKKEEAKRAVIASQMSEVRRYNL